MVAEKVVIETLSYQPGAEAVRWESDGSSEYELSSGSRTVPGTDIILYIDGDSKEFLEEARLRSVLLKYCAFLPRPVFSLRRKGGADKRLFPPLAEKTCRMHSGRI